MLETRHPILSWTALASLLLLALPGALAADAPDGPLPFERTEVRAPCAHYYPLKQPFFGETHIHTAYSFDAIIQDTRNTPEDAYRYAKGEQVGLPPWTDSRLQSDKEESSRPPPDGAARCDLPVLPPR